MGLLGAPLHPHRGAPRRVFERVIHQVAQRHRQSLGIGVDGADSGRCFQLDMAARRGYLRREFGHHALHQPGGVHFFEAILPHARFHAAEVEQRLHQPLQPRALAHQRFVIHLPPLLGRYPPFGQQFRQLADGRERRAEFVRHRRHEVRLHARHLQIAPHGPRDEVRAGDQKQRRHHGHQRQKSLPRHHPRIGGAFDAGEREHPRKLRFGDGADHRAARTALVPGHHAPFDVQRRAGNFAAREHRLEQAFRLCYQHRAPPGGAPPNQKKRSAIHPQSILPARTRLMLPIGPRARHRVRPDRRIGRHRILIAGEPAGVRPIERELPASQLPTCAQQVGLQRKGVFGAAGKLAEFVARHQVGRHAGHRGTVHRRQLGIGVAGFRNASSLAQHAGPAQQRTRPHSAILVLRQPPVPLDGFGGVVLLELDGLAFGEARRGSLGRRCG